MLQIGNQRVFFHSSEAMPELFDGETDFFITSPPYWNLKDYGHPDEIGKESYANYLDRLSAVWDQCFRAGRDGSILVVNVNSRRHKKQFYPLAFDIARTVRGWSLWDHVIWYIPNALPQPNHYIERLLDNKFESCLVFVKGDPDKIKFHKPRVPQKYAVADPRPEKKNPEGRCLGNIIRIPAYRPPNVKEGNYHVAAFPEELVAFFLACYTDAGDQVVDPFVGSGTTLKVSRVMAREGTGYEINPDYSDLINKRVLESWSVPDWRTVDLLHSSTMATSPTPRRREKQDSKVQELLLEMQAEIFASPASIQAAPASRSRVKVTAADV
jgi:DNA modification methylase